MEGRKSYFRPIVRRYTENKVKSHTIGHITLAEQCSALRTSESLVVQTHEVRRSAADPIDVIHRAELALIHGLKLITCNNIMGVYVVPESRTTYRALGSV